MCAADWPDAGLEMEEKLSFFRETRHAFGRTALLLSGGGGLGSFHLVSHLPLISNAHHILVQFECSECF
jgi:hypothetical protein